MRKIKDAVVKVGEYTKKNGETKANWKSVGGLFESDKGEFLLLDRTFNPAGIPNPDNKQTVLISLFAPRDAKPQQQRETQSRDFAQNNDFDDDLPF